MKLFVVNAGSTTLKFQLYNMPEEEVLVSGGVERLGQQNSFYTIKLNGKKDKVEKFIKDHKEAVDVVVEELINRGVIKSASEIKAVGHRVVSGAYVYNKPTLVTDEVIETLKSLIDFAPLHIPGSLNGIEACKTLNVPNVLVFDTAFHATMPKVAYTYAIKKEDAEKFHIRRYGAHGMSHQYCAEEVAKRYGDVKLINCHLGGGASITAVENGVCKDTSMGQTPLEGLVMGTRSGDIDASIVGYLADKKGMTAGEVVSYLTNECGLKGICGSSDMRDVEGGRETNEDCKLALDMFVYRVAKYVGAYASVLGGVDVINFTAGIGERGPLERKMVCDKLKYLGVEIDDAKNQAGEEEISTPSSKVKVCVIPTDEEIIIARATYGLVK